jgi:hypothetical protein
MPDAFSLPVMPDVLPKKTHPEAFWSLMRMAVAVGEDLVCFEDDIEPAPGAVHAIDSFHVPDDIALVTFLSDQFQRHAMWGLYRAPCTALRMLQAIKVPLRTMLKLLESPPSTSDPEVALILPLTGQRFGIHVPDLVKHVGLTSCNPLATTPPPVGTTFQPPPFEAGWLANGRAAGLYD